jgi:putative transcriptional regulator
VASQPLTLPQLYTGDADDGVLITLQRVRRACPSAPHAARQPAVVTPAWAGLVPHAAIVPVTTVSSAQARAQRAHNVLVGVPPGLVTGRSGRLLCSGRLACRVYLTLCRLNLTSCLVALTVSAVGRASAAGRRNGVRRARLLAELTQAQLAEAAGVARQTIVAIEAGDYAPSVYLALAICDRLGVTVEALFGSSGTASTPAYKMKEFP